MKRNSENPTLGKDMITIVLTKYNQYDILNLNLGKEKFTVVLTTYNQYDILNRKSTITLEKLNNIENFV